MNIEWKASVDAPHLMISNTGLCYSNKYKRLLKLQLVGFPGYKYLSFGYKVNGLAKHFTIHRQVAKLFIPNPENKPVVNHKDGDKLNNAVENLEWATHSENSLHAVITGLNPKRGQDHHNAKISNENAVEIIYLKKMGFKQPFIASEFNLNQSTVSRIVNNKTYFLTNNQLQ